jgi:hypothetical protein
MSTKTQVRQAIEAEIKWHQDYPTVMWVPIEKEYKKGFIAGLRQALFFFDHEPKEKLGDKD